MVNFSDFIRHFFPELTEIPIEIPIENRSLRNTFMCSWVYERIRCRWIGRISVLFIKKNTIETTSFKVTCGKLLVLSATSVSGTIVSSRTILVFFVRTAFFPRIISRSAFILVRFLNRALFLAIAVFLYLTIWWRTVFFATITSARVRIFWVAFVSIRAVVLQVTILFVWFYGFLIFWMLFIWELLNSKQTCTNRDHINNIR